ncbi:MAG: phosphoenolpyruvate carboxykinase [Candidatus Cryptobacteroides sp.]
MDRIAYCYKVAGLSFRLLIPGGREARELLPSFSDFATDDEGSPIFSFDAAGLIPGALEGRKMDESDTDLGHLVLSVLESGEDLRGYLVELQGTAEGPVHRMYADPAFSELAAELDWDAPDAGRTLSSMLRIAFSQAVLRHGGISIHSSAVAADGRAYLFLGSSGTGKSTHSQMWMRTFRGCGLVNDDNPVLRVEDGEVFVYGSPWSGKTPCYRDVKYPVAGLARLRQSGENRFRKCTDVDAFVALLPSCSVVKGNKMLQDCLFDTITAICDRVPVGVMDCLPDCDSARICRKGLDFNI